MGNITGYVVGDDGSMRPVRGGDGTYGDLGTVDGRAITASVVSVFEPDLEPDLEAIAAAAGVDLEDLGDIDAKVAESGGSVEDIAAVVGVTPLQVRALVVALAGLADGDVDSDDDGLELGKHEPDPDGNAGAQAPDYSQLSKKQLEEEVKLRNSERSTDDADYIVVDAPGNKPELVAALEADDQVED